MPRVAVIGAGYWGKNLVRNFHGLGALAAICDGDSGTRQSMEEQYPNCTVVGSYEGILRDESLTAVVIATPAESHAELVRAAILAGKDVFVEKPMALQRKGAEELVTLAAKHGRVLMVGHLLWYHPAVLKLRQLIDSGELGRIQYIYSNRLNLGKIRREENILWSFAPHDISVILGLLGEMPLTVQSQGGNYLHEKVADVTTTTMSFASGVRSHIFVSWLHPYKEQRLVVVGDKKMVVFNDAEPKNKLMAYAHQVEWVDRKPVAKKADAVPIPVDLDEPLKLECAHFIDCVITRKTPRTDGREGLAVLSVLDACQQSLDQQSAIVQVNKPQILKNYIVHTSSYVDEAVEIGEGTKIWHFSHVLIGSKIGRNCNIGQNVVIGPNATIGNNVKIQNNVSVYQGVTLEDDVFCGPSMVFTNVINPRSAIRRMDELKSTLVKKGVSIGANATIVCGVTLGASSFIGAGAVVTKDVPDFALVLGNPARIAGWMCRCGVRLAFDNHKAKCAVCGAAYLESNQRVQSVV